MKEIELSYEETENILKDSSRGFDIHVDLFFPNDETVSKERILEIKSKRKALGEIVTSEKGVKYYRPFSRKPKNER